MSKESLSQTISPPHLTITHDQALSEDQFIPRGEGMLKNFLPAPCVGLRKVKMRGKQPDPSDSQPSNCGTSKSQVTAAMYPTSSRFYHRAKLRIKKYLFWSTSSHKHLLQVLTPQFGLNQQRHFSAGHQAAFPPRRDRQTTGKPHCTGYGTGSAPHKNTK